MKEFDNKDNTQTTRLDMPRRTEEREKPKAERSGMVGRIEELISKIKAMFKKGGEEGPSVDDLFVEVYIAGFDHQDFNACFVHVCYLQNSNDPLDAFAQGVYGYNI